MESDVPFQLMIELWANPVPDTCTELLPLPSTNSVGETDVITGVTVDAEIVRSAEEAPPGAGFTTVTLLFATTA